MFEGVFIWLEKKVIQYIFIDIYIVLFSRLLNYDMLTKNKILVRHHRSLVSLARHSTK